VSGKGDTAREAPVFAARGVVGFAVMRLIDRRLFVTIVAAIVTSMVILWVLIFLLLLVAGPF
jgi:hypothetical protein